jgi:hypothetical protein
MVLINANFDNTRVDKFIIRGRQPYMFWVFNISTNIISYKLPSDRLNNHSQSRELITFLYDVADL